MFKNRAIALCAAAVLAALLITSACSSPTTAPPPTMDTTVGYLQIFVQNPSKAPAAGAKVVSQSQPDGQLSVNGITNDEGLVTFSKVKPGKYEFAVSLAGAAPAVAAVNLAAGQPVAITVALEKAAAP